MRPTVMYGQLAKKTNYVYSDLQEKRGKCRDRNTGRFRIRKNRQLKDLIGEPDIVDEIKAQRPIWVGHVQRQSFCVTRYSG